MASDGTESVEATVTYEVLDTTRDTGDPVFRVRVQETGSKMDAILDRAERVIRVWHVRSERRGDMSQMLDGLVSELGWTDVCFLSPLDDLKEDGATRLIDRLDGFEKVTETIKRPDGKREKQDRYVGTWAVGSS